MGSVPRFVWQLRSARPDEPKRDSVENLRKGAENSPDSEHVGHWLLGELIAPERQRRTRRARQSAARTARRTGHGRPLRARLGRFQPRPVQRRLRPLLAGAQGSATIERRARTVRGLVRGAPSDRLPPQRQGSLATLEALRREHAEGSSKYRLARARRVGRLVASRSLSRSAKGLRRLGRRFPRLRQEAQDRRPLRAQRRERRAPGISG